MCVIADEIQYFTFKTCLVWGGALANEIRYAAEAKAAAEATCTATLCSPAVSVRVHVGAHSLHLKCQKVAPRKVGPFGLVQMFEKMSEG